MTMRRLTFGSTPSAAPVARSAAIPVFVSIAVRMELREDCYPSRVYNLTRGLPCMSGCRVGITAADTHDARNVGAKERERCLHDDRPKT